MKNWGNPSELGYDAGKMDALAKLTPSQQQLALTNGPTLPATAGYDGKTINDLARLTFVPEDPWALLQIGS